MLHEVLQDLESYPAFATDKTSLTRSMSSAIHEAFEDKKKKFFENRKSLSANMRHYQEAYRGRLMEQSPHAEALSYFWQYIPPPIHYKD